MILNQPIFEAIVSQVQAGRPAALCVVVARRGSTPQSPGAMMLVDSGMNILGTLGGGCVEAEIRKRAFELLESGEPACEQTLSTNDDLDWDDSLICGGAMDFAIIPIRKPDEIEPYKEALDAMVGGRPTHLELSVLRQGQPTRYRVLVEAEPRLIIAGAGHVGAELARMCVGLEFDVTVIDDRADLLTPERLPDPIRRTTGDIEQTLRSHPIDNNSYVVIVTRGHKHDEDALSAVVASPAKYLGMIGSKGKIRKMFESLQSKGVTEQQLKCVHAPIGLDIRSITVPEIAVSIAAQLIATRRADYSKLVEGPFSIEEQDS